ncbi:MAG TPA: polysaccharide deacetylase family protein, partial [Cyclobacteriaceae bacterium]|nr:polysaccharide deacetylase family protein [Cyclobacteriaceae bacterium]
MPATEKKLYLTFDDGPVPGPTDFVLATLAKYSIKAAFFCIGDNVRKHPEIFKRILDQGHAVGNHTFNHLKGWNTPLEKYVENVEECEDVINKSLDNSLQLPVTGDRQPATGHQKLFRPPYGRITRAQIKALTNYKIVMWDVLTNDYRVSKSPQAVLKNSIRATRPGSVVVFHDSVKAERNMNYALPRYIDHFISQGY